MNECRHKYCTNKIVFNNCQTDQRKQNYTIKKKFVFTTFKNGRFVLRMYVCSMAVCLCLFSMLLLQLFLFYFTFFAWLALYSKKKNTQLHIDIFKFLFCTVFRKMIRFVFFFVTVNTFSGFFQVERKFFFIELVMMVFVYDDTKNQTHSIILFLLLHTLLFLLLLLCQKIKIRKITFILISTQ